MISIDRVHPDHTEALLSLYVDLFYDREPLTRCLGLSRERMISIAQSMHSEAESNPIAQGLCWIARDCAAANKAVGFIATADPVAEGGQEIPENLTAHEREKVLLLLALLDEIRKPVIGQIGEKAGESLHIAAIGVAPGYEGAGIATSLLQTALADATARGFAHAFSECTSIASRKCHEKTGFRELNRVAVNEFSVNGACPLTSSNLTIYLMWKSLIG